MPRYARRLAPHTVQHVIARFLNREFLLDVEGARDEYLRRVAAVMGRTDWRPVGFALMSSHVHWVFEAGEQPSSSFVKPLHSGFAGWLNRAQRRQGPVFSDRHRTVVVTGDTVATLLAYVHNNPVRAGLVGDPADSTWTSHAAYVGSASPPPWLDVERGLELAGFSDTRAGRRAFQRFVLSRCGEGRCAMVSGGGMPRHRTLARLEMKAPVEIGTPTVTKRGGRVSMVVPTIVPPGCRVSDRATISAESVIGAVARVIGVAVTAVGSSRGRSAVRGRRLAMLIWVRHLERPAVQMARALGIAESTASGLLATASHQTRELALRIARDAIITRSS